MKIEIRKGEQSIISIAHKVLCNLLSIRHIILLPSEHDDGYTIINALEDELKATSPHLDSTLRQNKAEKIIYFATLVLHKLDSENGITLQDCCKRAILNRLRDPNNRNKKDISDIKGGEAYNLLCEEISEVRTEIEKGPYPEITSNLIHELEDLITTASIFKLTRTRGEM